jgi:DnaJ-class molecular chaperone
MNIPSAPDNYFPVRWPPETTITTGKAELCPVCKGDGWLNKVYPIDTASQRYTLCHGCGGKGWVVIP